MGLLDAYKSQIHAYFSDWIKISDDRSLWTIEDFPYATGVDENLTSPHCWKCVTVNQCWFKNEDKKKPEHFDYNNYSFTQVPKSKRGLYHPNCHCKEKAINVPRLKNLLIIKDDRKIKKFFDSKFSWFRGWGYLDKDKNTFINIVQTHVLEEYRKGNYEEEKHTRYGFQINVLISIPGTNEKLGRFYDVKSAFMVFPNGKLRLITVIGGKNNERL